MSSHYEKRILQVLGKNKEGLTTVNVAEKADISKTTALKYLASLRTESRIDFMEVGPAKLWRLKKIERPKDKQETTSRIEKIEHILKEFTETIELEGSAVLDTDGLMISADMPLDADTERMGSLISHLLKIGTKSMSMAKMDPLEEIIVEGEKGRIVARNEGKVLLIAFCNPETPLGTVKIEIEEFAKKINEILA